MNYYPYFVIPVNGGLLHVFELLHENIEPIDSTLEYFRPFYQAYFKLSGKIDAIYIEYLTPKWIELFDKLNIGHLIIFTNICKEE
ncbi:hypothetical protein JV173_04190 [Acholeplasma equirhinis]|uniref:hypothetical protein n=1 Tax=Acholeplasma equirhinis TaxID=555393 RepID=UPI00197AA806|nr:hypothetical protein [Acholeplasma equirhinis]MBN3490711.1 hypothetical protein [Acholeplasma equirhinis]